MIDRNALIAALTGAILGKTAPQAVAQAHADAAHWAKTRLGDMIGGELCQ